MKNNSQHTGMTFIESAMLLTVLLVIAKILKVIEITWVWVFAPLWIVFGGSVLFFTLAIVLLFVVRIIEYFIEMIRRKRREKKYARTKETE